MLTILSAIALAAGSPIGIAAAGSTGVDERPVEEAAPKETEERSEPPLGTTAGTSSVSRLKIGGAIRGRYDLRFNDVRASGERRTSSHASFDALILTLDYDSPKVFGAAQYRFYGGSFIYGRANGYENYPGEVNFPVYAYVGVKLNSKDKVAVGIQSVPFDDRWWGSAFFNSLGFAYGMEEVYNAGISYSHAEAHTTFDVGFFPTTAPAAFGISEDSARFSVNIVKGDNYVPNGSRNGERNMVVGRIQHQLLPVGKTKLMVTGSGWISTVYNFDTRGNGSRRSFAVSLRGERGAWHAKVLGARQSIEPRNAGRTDLISVGDYDSSYNIAAKGSMVFGELGVKIDTGGLPFTVMPYANYARFIKDRGDFVDTERLTVGAFWSDKATGRIRVWSDLMIGRNDPYVGAGQFLSGAGQGGDSRIKASFLVLAGYYF